MAVPLMRYQRLGVLRSRLNVGIRGQGEAPAVVTRNEGSDTRRVKRVHKSILRSPPIRPCVAGVRGRKGRQKEGSGEEQEKKWCTAFCALEQLYSV